MIKGIMYKEVIGVLTIPVSKYNIQESKKKWLASLSFCQLKLMVSQSYSQRKNNNILKNSEQIEACGQESLKLCINNTVKNKPIVLPML